MRLSDIMSNMGLAIYPTVALVLFLAIFAGVVWRLLRIGREEIEACARLPFSENCCGPVSEDVGPESEHR